MQEVNDSNRAFQICVCETDKTRHCFSEAAYYGVNVKGGRFNLFNMFAVFGDYKCLFE